MRGCMTSRVARLTACFVTCACGVLWPMLALHPRINVTHAPQGNTKSDVIRSYIGNNVLMLNNHVYYPESYVNKSLIDDAWTPNVTVANLPQFGRNELNIERNDTESSERHVNSTIVGNGHQRDIKFMPNHTEISSDTILILFTTFKNSPDRLYPQSQIVLNWAQYKPWIQPVLYTPDTEGPLVELALEQGWHIFSEQGANKHGTPLLKPMYYHAMSQYNTTYYGFANGDILFNSGLLDTVKYMHVNRKKYNTTIITGRRWNFPYYKYMSDINKLGDIWPSEKVQQIQKQSRLFTRDAEDYFIVTCGYPFSQIKDVVIGRPGYDNYLIARSIQLNVSSVDATATISAVHITLNGSIFAGSHNPDSRFNKNLIGRFNYNAGITTATRFATDSRSGVIGIKQRWDPIEKAKRDKEKRERKQAEKKEQEEKKKVKDKKV